MQFEFKGQGRLGHLVPAFLDVGVQLLRLVLVLTNNHALHILVSDVPVAHVHLQTLEL